MASVRRAKFKLPKLSPEAKLIGGLVGLAVWIGWRVRRGLDVLPFGIADAVGGFLAQSVQGYKETGADLANRPDSQTPTAFESTGAVIGRLAGQEKPPEVKSTPDRPAAEGPYLGPPKNALLVAGVVRSPAAGSTVQTKLAADTFDVDAAIENQAADPRSGEISVRVREKNLLGHWVEQSVSGGKTTLAPGEFRDVTVRAPNAVGRPFSPLESEVSLRFAGYTLSTVRFKRNYPFL